MTRARRGAGALGSALLGLLPALVLTISGCVQPRFLQSAPQREWAETLGQAHAAAEVGRFAAADTLLADFASRYPDSEQASETIFWRAVFRLDPANPDASTSEAVTGLTAYLARPGPHGHLAEARALRRAAVRTDSLVAAAGRRGSAPAEAAPATTEKDAEIAKLREELKKATEELDRIKRRLSTPTP